MSGDPLPPNPAGAWVTAGPTHNLLIWLGLGIDLMMFFFRHMH